MFWEVLRTIQKNLTYSIPIVMILGIVLGSFIDTEVLKALIIPMTLLMVYPMMVNIKYQELVGFNDLKVQASALAINFLIIPFVAVALIGLFLADRPYMALGLLLAALVPTSGMTISWTGFANGNFICCDKNDSDWFNHGLIIDPFICQCLARSKCSHSFTEGV